MTKKPVDRNYDVGYGKPPVASRFKPGQSGNPRGRPKKKLSVSDLVAKVAEEKVAAVIDGQSVKMSKMMALVRAMFAGAMKGNQRAANQLFVLMREAEALNPKNSVKHVVSVEVIEPDGRRYDPTTVPPRSIDRSAKPTNAAPIPSRRHPLE